MNFNLVSWASGIYSLHIPQGEEHPEIKRPDLWVGLGADQNRGGRGIIVKMGGALGDEAVLFQANGKSKWKDQLSYGVEILEIHMENVVDKEFALDFLKLWLRNIFAVDEITFYAVDGLANATAGT